MAELEQLYYGGRPFSLIDLQKKVQGLSEGLKNLLNAFQELSGGKNDVLCGVYQKIKSELDLELNPQMTYPSQDPVLPLESVSPEKRDQVGAKAGNLAAIRTIWGCRCPKGSSSRPSPTRNL